MVTVRFSKKEEVVLPEPMGRALGLCDGDRIEIRRQGSMLWFWPKRTTRSPRPLTDLAMIISSSQPIGSVDVKETTDKHGYEQVRLIKNVG